jgi:hypothetical protein
MEPGGRLRAEAFSTYVASGPFILGTPDEYACRKAAAFPEEGGAAILAIEVPDDIISLAVTEYFPLTQGLVQFGEGAGLEELRTAWPDLETEVHLIECP